MSSAAGHLPEDRLFAGDDDAALGLVLRRSFPDLSWRTARRIETGADHIVLELDGSWIARFRRRRLRLPLTEEARLLGVLAAASPLPVPVYRHVSPDGACGVYRRLPGHPLAGAAATPCLPEAMRAIGAFLSRLHALPAAAADLPEMDAPPEPWQPMPALEPQEDPGLVRSSTRAILNRCLAEPVVSAATERCVVHGDLDARHILVRAGRISGVIDFSDAACGDPALDFAGLWSFGGWAPRAALRGYCEGAGRPHLLERSRLLFLRSMARLLTHAAGKRDLHLIGLVERAVALAAGEPQPARPEAVLPAADAAARHRPAHLLPSPDG